MFGERTIRNNFIQEKKDTKMRPVYNIGTGITGRTPIQKPKMGYTCCSILQQRNRKLKLENHELKAREKKATQRCADLKEDNVRLNNLLKSTINSNRESAESKKDRQIKQLEAYAYEAVKDYNSLSKEYNDQAVKSNQRIAELEAKCEQFRKNAIDFKIKEGNRNWQNSVRRVKKDNICAEPATLEARCEQLRKNTIDLKKKRKRQNSANSHFANSAEPTASNFQKCEIKCEICDEEFNLTFKLNRHLTKCHDNVEEKNSKNDNKVPKTVESEKSEKKEKFVNLIRPKNPTASDSKPILNVHREFSSNTKVSNTLSLKASKDQTYCKKNTKIYPQIETEQPLEENKLEPGTSGLENPKFFLQDEDEVAWAYRKLSLEQ